MRGRTVTRLTGRPHGRGHSRSGLGPSSLRHVPRPNPPSRDGDPNPGRPHRTVRVAYQSPGACSGGSRNDAAAVVAEPPPRRSRDTPDNPPLPAARKGRNLCPLPAILSAGLMAIRPTHGIEGTHCRLADQTRVSLVSGFTEEPVLTSPDPSAGLVDTRGPMKAVSDAREGLAPNPAPCPPRNGTPGRPDGRPGVESQGPDGDGPRR